MALAVTVPGFMALFLGLGMESANVYFSGSDRIEPRRLGHNSTLVTLAATAVAAILLSVTWACGWLARILPGVNSSVLALAMVAFPFLLASSTFGGILLGRQLIEVVTTIGFAQKVLALALMLILVAGAAQGLRGAVVATTLAAIIGTIPLAVHLRRAGGRLMPGWDPACLKKTLGFGLRGYMGNLLQFFNYRLDLFLVNYFLGASGAGLYAVAVSVAEMLWYIPNAVGYVVFPRSAGHDSGDPARLARDVFLPTLGLSVLCAVALAAIGGPLIRLLFSTRFANAYLPMMALLPGAVMLGSTRVLSNNLAGRGFPHYNAIVSGLTLPITIVGDLVLIPRWGVLGASVASSVAYTTTFILIVLFFRKAGARISERPVES